MDILNASANGIEFNLFMQGALGAHVLVFIFSFVQQVACTGESIRCFSRTVGSLQFMGETDCPLDWIAGHPSIFMKIGSSPGNAFSDCVQPYQRCMTAKQRIHDDVFIY